MSTAINKQTFKAANKAPVVIKRKEKAYVLLTQEAYSRLLMSQPSALDLIMSADCPDVSEIDLPIPPRSNAQRREVDFGKE